MKARQSTGADECARPGSKILRRKRPAHDSFDICIDCSSRYIDKLSLFILKFENPSIRMFQEFTQDFCDLPVPQLTRVRLSAFTCEL
jgi:hypothetical protein